MLSDGDSDDGYNPALDGGISGGQFDPRLQTLKPQVGFTPKPPFAMAGVPDKMGTVKTAQIRTIQGPRTVSPPPVDPTRVAFKQPDLYGISVLLCPASYLLQNMVLCDVIGASAV
jgi:hypothetical protein